MERLSLHRHDSSSVLLFSAEQFELRREMDPRARHTTALLRLPLPLRSYMVGRDLDVSAVTGVRYVERGEAWVGDR